MFSEFHPVNLWKRAWKLMSKHSPFSSLTFFDRFKVKNLNRLKSNLINWCVIFSLILLWSYFKTIRSIVSRLLFLIHLIKYSKYLVLWQPFWKGSDIDAKLYISRPTFLGKYLLILTSWTYFQSIAHELYDTLNMKFSNFAKIDSFF